MISLLGPTTVRFLVSGLLAVPVLFAGTSSAAFAAGSPSGPTFGFSAQPAGTAGSFFDLDVVPGTPPSAHAISVLNTSSTIGTVEVLAALGVTAANTGDAYQVNASGCQGAACWITGLPPTVQLTPGQARNVSFAVAVPSGTPNGQYLAGVVVRSGAKPTSTSVGNGSGAGATLHFVTEVDMGVAITVGPRAALSPALEIMGVAQRPGGGVVARINVRNTGNAFVHSAGTLAVELHDGTRQTLSATSDTVLPGDTAGIDVALGNLADGSYPASVSLRFWDQPARTATWSGTLVLGKVVGAFGHAGPPAGAPAAARKSSSGVPIWVIAALIFGALLAVGGLGLLVGRRSAGPAHPPAPAPAPASGGTGEARDPDESGSRPLDALGSAARSLGSETPHRPG